MENIQLDEILTPESRQRTQEDIVFLEKQLNLKEGIFGPLQPSTLTVCGQIGPILFEEKDIIDMLSTPTGKIRMIGCNFGELFNPDYVVNKPVKKAGRGRKPKVKKASSTRKAQGSGKYFSSQITFAIEGNAGTLYKIKLFRTGTFQVPGVMNPSVSDLTGPINTLVAYLREEFMDDTIRVERCMVSMRNYKTTLSNVKYRVDLKELEHVLQAEKDDPKYVHIFGWIFADYSEKNRDIIANNIGNMHPMRFAELGINADQCFSMIMKLDRPILGCPKKKTTIKLLAGKLNFDGGNSSEEVSALYFYFMMLYNKHRDRILINIDEIGTESCSECSEVSIYDDDIQNLAKKEKA